MSRPKTVLLASLVTVGWLVIYLAALPWMAQHLPHSWWLDVRSIRVDSETQLVTIDRDIHAAFFDRKKLVLSPETGRPEMRRYWPGSVEVNIRPVGGVPYETPECRGPERPMEYVDGQPYPAAPVDLDWFQSVPPYQSCHLTEGEYVADFTWRRWLGPFQLQFTQSSNIFRISAATAARE